MNLIIFNIYNIIMIDEDEIINPENMIIDSPLPISIEGTEEILNQMRYSVGKIKIENEVGSCFFCNIVYENKKSSVLMTANHVINESNIKQFKYIDLNDKRIPLDINEKTKIYYNKNYDITIIEIKNKIIKEEDKVKIKYLELDNIFKESHEIIFENKSIYIPQYPNGQEVVVSYGILKHIKDMTIKHRCCTDKGSSGSPILNLSNNKLIGLHKGGGKNYNFGTFLKIPIQEYFSMFEKENEINLVIEVDAINNDLNEKIYFLGETSNYFEKKIHNLEELDHTNSKLYINEKKYEFKKYFTPEKEGKYNIKIKLKTIIKDCSFMFYNCKYITKIDLSNFNSINIEKAENMFEFCIKLREINLTNFNTKKIHNMEKMFYGCENLEKIDLSKFNTENVLSMNSMFMCCYSLQELDLSSFNTKNVLDMEKMFCHCKALNKINLRSFNTENIKNIQKMFYDCEKLKEIDLSSFNINRNNLKCNNMFSNYSNIKSLIIRKGKFNTNILTILKKYKNIRIIELNK